MFSDASMDSVYSNERPEYAMYNITHNQPSVLFCQVMS